MLRLTTSNRWGIMLTGGLSCLAVALYTFFAPFDMAKPDLKRLYELANNSSSAPTLPVILIPGVFGSRLTNPSTGEELWPGAWHRIFFSTYEDLRLDIDDSTLKLKPSKLVTTGIAENALQRDFYRPILKTLTEYGGYTKTQVGTPVKAGERHLYIFAYDWRLDIVDNVRALDQLITAIQRDYGNPTQQVNIVAHSMGGLIARYYLRHGTRDVLGSTSSQVTMIGAKNVDKLILLGTPNLGSVSSLHGFISGEKILWNRIAPSTLASFPSGYQLFPHPLNTWLLDINGKAQPDDLFDIKTWQKFEWSLFDRKQATRMSATELSTRQRFFALQLERARRLAWMLSVEEPISPVRYVLFGGGCHATPARLLMERSEGRDVVRLYPSQIANPKIGLAYDSFMMEPGDGRVTKPSLLARETLDPSAPQNEDSFLPVAYSFFLCETHAELTNNINFQDNLLHILLSQKVGMTH
jgi:pimeloyl-ACP methyl ester carboxylesterase